MKKALIILLILFIFAGCQKQKEEENLYIDPIDDKEIFSYLNQETYNLLYAANNNQIVENYVLESIGLKLPELILEDIYGNKINLNDFNDKKVVFEVVANWCSSCKKQVFEYNDSIINKYNDDIVFVQYFNEGNIEQIKAFYLETNLDYNSDLIIIPSNEEFSKILKNEYNLVYYPSFLFFNSGVLNFIASSFVEIDQFDKIYDLVYQKDFNSNKLIDKNGDSIFKYNRSALDVLNELSDENKDKLYLLDNDDITIKNTLEYIGKQFDFYKQYENDSTFISEVNFLDYFNGDLVIIYYAYDNDENIEMINSFYELNKNDVQIIVLNISDDNNTLLQDLLNPPLVSIMNQVPKMLNDIAFDNCPSALYIQNGIITGAYSNINNLDLFNESVNIFLKDSSIALKNNNQ